MQPRRPVRKLASEELFEYSVKYLSLQGCSSDHLRSKLRQKAANLPDVESVVARLKDIGYLNDQRFAQSYAANRAENDGFGRFRVLSDLRARRVPPKLAEKVVEQVFEGKDEGQLIDAFIDRRMRSLTASGLIENDRQLAIAYRRLRRAGFSSGGSLAALKRLAARPDLIDEPPPEDEEVSGE